MGKGELRRLAGGLLLWGLFGTAQAAVTPVDLGGPVSDWDVIMQGANFDPGGDQQASANSSVDLVGTDNDATLLTAYDDKGTTSDVSDDEVAYRLRVGGSKGGAFSGYIWIGMDVDLDGDLDAFINLYGNGKTGAAFDGEVSVYGAGTDLNTSPSTSSAENKVSVTLLQDNGTNYDFSIVDNTTDPSASNTDINLDNETDRFINFKVNWQSLRDTLNNKPLTDPSGALIGSIDGGTGITKDTPIAYTLSTSTNSNNVNSDVGGFDDKNDDMSVSYEDQGAFSPPLSVSNIFPEITSDGGGDTAVLSVDENTAAVTTVTASDANGDTLSFAISGGADAALFSIDASGGALVFQSAPDYENPGDSDTDNAYEVTVTADDGKGGTDSQAITVNVQDVVEDATAPTVDSIIRQSPTDAVTNADNPTFRVTFDEAVQNVDTTDFVASGTAAGSATIDGVTAQSTSIYDVTVGGVSTADGDLSLGFGGTQDVVDTAGNALSGTTPTGSDESYTLDNTAPSLSSATVNGASLTLSYDEMLGSASVPAIGDYTVSVNGSAVTLSSVGVSGADVNITLDSAVNNGDIVTLDYTAGTSPVQDAVGNASANLSGESVTNNTADTTPPATPVISGVTGDTGASNSDGITSDTTLLLSGTAEANSTVEVFLDGNSIGTTTTNGSGDWSFDHTGTSLGEGTYSFTATATDAASNTSSPSDALSVTIDTSAPAKPTVTSITDDTGASSTDGVTSDQTLAINGTAEANASVDVFVDGAGVGTTTANGSGDWSFDYSGTSLTAGSSYGLTAEATDTAGNTSLPSDGFSATIDTAVPTLDAATVSDSTLTLSYSETLNGGIVPAASDYTVTVNGSATTVSAVAVSGTDVTLTLGSAVANGDTVSLDYAAGTSPVEDSAGNVAGNLSGQGVTNNTADTTAPTVDSIVRQSPTDAITNADSLTFRVSFGEAVQNVDAGDFVASGTAAGSATINNVAAPSSSIYDVTIGGVSTADGYLSLVFDGTQNIADTAGNALTDTTPSGSNESYTLDNTAPNLGSATVDGTSLTLGYDETLDSGSVPATGDYTVNVNGSAVTLSSVGVSGADVSLTLASAVNNGDTVTLDYTVVTDPVQDAVGNTSAALTGEAVTNNTADTTAPTVTSILRQSPTDATTNADSLTFRVSFDEAVQSVTSDDFSVGGTAGAGSVSGVAGVDGRTYDVTVGSIASANGTVTLSFAAGQDITDTSGNALSDTMPSGSNESYTLDNIAPVLSSATVDGSSLVLAYDDMLDSGSVPATGDYTVNVNGSAVSLSSVGVSGSDVTLTLTSAVSNGDTVTVDYTVGTNPVQDAVGNASANLSGESVTNNTADTTAPTAESIVRQSPTDAVTNADNPTFRVTFDEAVQNVDATDFVAGGTAAGSATIDNVAAQSSSIYDVTIGGVSTADGDLSLGFDGAQDIADTTGNALSDTTSTGSDEPYTLDNTAPVLSSATVDGTGLTLAYDEALDSGSVPATGDYTVTVNGSVVALSGVGVSGTDVSITLDSTVNDGDTVTLDYTVGTNPVQDAVGNTSAALSGEAVTNNTADATAPTVESVVRQSPADEVTNADSPVFRVTFDEAVQSVDTTDFVASGTAAGSATIDNVTAQSTSIYDVTIGGVSTADGDLNLGFDGAQDIADTSGNALSDTAPTGSDEFYTLDNTAPTFGSATVDGADLTLSYDETLDSGSVPSTGEYTVNVNGSAVTLSGVGISGTEVNITLDSAVNDGDTVTLDYTVGTNPVQDAVGNTSTALSGEAVTNSTADTTAPTVASIVRQSPADATTNADSLTFRVTFDEAVQNVDTTDFVANGTAAASATIDSATSQSSSIYDVTIGGVSLADGDLSLGFDGTQDVADTSGNALSDTAPAGSDESYALDNTAPSLISATVDGVSLTLSYDETLGSGSVPATGDYTVNVNGSAVTLSTVSITGSDVVITLDVAVNNGDTVTVDYTAGTNAVQDAVGNTSAALSDEAVTNNTADTTPPRVDSILRQSPANATTNADNPTFRVTFDEAVQNVDVADFVTSGAAGGSAVIVSVTVQSSSIYDVTIGGVSTADGALNLGFDGGQNIADPAGNTLTDTTPTGNSEFYTLDNTAPSLGSATVDGTGLTLSYDETLDSASVPAAGDYTVNVNGSAIALSGVGISGSDLVIVLDSAVSDGDTVTVDYTAGTNTVQDAVGNAVSALSGRSVTNNTADTKAPTVESIVRQSPINAVTNADNPVFRVTFDEAVQNVDTTDFVVSGTAAGSATIDSVTEQSSLTYDVIIGGVSTADGDLSLGFDGSQDVADTSGNALSDTTPTGSNESYTLDNTAPTFGSATVDGADLTLSYDETLDSGSVPATVDYTVTINGSVVTLNSVGISGTDVSIMLDTAANNGSTVTLDYTAGTNPLQDVVGNTSVALSGEAVINNTADTTAPTVDSILRQSPADATTNADGLTFRVNFDEAVQNVTSGDFSVGGTTGAGSVTAASAVNGSTYDITVGSIASANGTVTLGFAAGQDISDTAGNALTDTTPSGSHDSYTLDNIAPVLSSATVDGSSLVLAYDDMLDSGSAPATGDFTVKVNSSAVGLGSVGVSGSDVTLTLASAVSSGDTVTVDYTAGANPVQDAVGNASTNLFGVNVTNSTADTTPPATPVISGVTDDTGASDSDGITSDTTLLISGTAEANSTVEVFLNGGSIGTTTANGSGDWSLDHTGASLGEGTYNLTATAEDAASNTSSPSNALSVTIDTSAPAKPAVTSITDDTGASSTDGVTSDQTLVINGTAEAGASVAVFVDGVGVGTTTANGGGDWSFDYTGTSLAAGNSYALTAQATDAAGNTSVASDGFSVTIDTAVPTLNTATVSDSTLTLGYSESLNGASVPAISDYTVTVNGSGATVSAVAVSATDVTLTLGSAVSNGDTVSLNYSAGASPVQDTAGNAAANLSGQGVTNDTADTTAPTVDSIVRQNPADAITNADSPTFRVSFDEAVQNVGTADFVASGTAAGSAVIDSVTEQTASTYDVTIGGVSAAAGDLSLGFGGSQDIADTSGNALTDTTPAGSYESYTLDNTAPTLSSATVDGTDLTLAYDETLDGASVPAASDYAVTVNGSAVTLGSVGVNGADVTIALASAVNDGDTVTLDYTAGTNPVQDAVGNTSTALSGEAVMNNTADTTAPTVDNIVRQSPADVVTNADTPTFRVAFGEAVQNVDATDFVASGTAAASATIDSVAAQSSSIYDVTIGGVNTADGELRLGFDGAQDIADTSGNVLSDTAPTGSDEFYTLDNTAPSLGSATVDGTSMMLSYGEALDNGSVPATGDYTVNVNGSAVTLSGVGISGSDVVITLDAAVDNGDTVTVDYTASTNPVQDGVGNPVSALSGQGLTNNTADTTAPTVDSIVRHSPVEELTNADNPTFRVTFDEAVQNVAAGDFVATGSAAGSATIDNVAVQSTTVYDVTIGGVSTADGDLGLGFDGGQDITDAAGNALADTTPSGSHEIYTLDNTAPGGALVTAIADDTGRSNEDHETRDQTLIFSGTAEADSSVDVILDGSTIGTVPADGNGDWSLDHTGTSLAEGSYTVSARATDEVGNEGAAGMPFLDLEIDLTAPANATLAENGDALGDDTPTLTGTAEPGSHIKLTVDGQEYTATTDSNGDWSLSINVDNALADGGHGVSVSVTDPAGNSTSDNGYQITIDTRLPAQPVVAGISEDTGASDADGNTTDQSLMIGGTSEADAEVEVFLDGASLGTVAADEDGNWSFDHTGTNLAEGDYVLTAVATDTAGNGSATSTGFGVTIDRTAPATPSLDQDGEVLIDNTPDLGGNAEAGAQVTVTLDGESYSTTADGSGVWGLTVTQTLANGTYPLDVSALDVAGNETMADAGIEIDTDQDSDGDGISDLEEGTGDADGDGTPNYLDTDSDGDGIPDSTEGTTDTDGDGTPNYLDTDSDGDGKLDADEATGDVDGDGIPNYIDADDNDGPDGDLDGDGLTNEKEEALGSDPDSDDTDGDGIDDANELGDDPDNPKDSDGDGIPDYLDPDDDPSDGNDSDGDGIPDTEECPGGIPCPDTDGDGLPDYMDPDDDGDGIPSSTEGATRDTDGDGVPDYLDEDDDGDGTLTRLEDDDSDNDGDPSTNPGPDMDGDGIPAYLDPNDGLAGLGDADSDGLTDDQECADGPSCKDTDSDGVPDYMDPDDDGDGVATVDEDLDGDGDPRNEDTDGDGVPDYLDTDDDGDGIDTDQEGTGDVDADGIPDYLDADSDNSAGTADGSGDSDGDGLSDRQECASGVPCQDTDGDGAPDYLDPDDDGDGIDTIDEDLNGNGDPRDEDTDGDGLPNYLDPDDDNDGVSTLTEGDGDSNGDGIPDYLQSGVGDSDGDGLGDAIECPGGIPCPDTDGDGLPDYMDPDDDGDGILTLDEDLKGNGDPRDDDTDGDGVPNYLDADDDNDGIASVIEGTGDSDGDGIPDYLDADSTNNVATADGSGDSDGDGRSDLAECPTGVPCADSNNNGIPDYMDNPVKNSTVPTGRVKTGLSGAGAGGLWPLLLLVLGGLWRRRAVLLLLLLPGLSQAGMSERLYGGAGLGYADLDPDASDAGYTVADDSDTGWLILGGYQWRPHWSAELLYTDLGEAGLKARASGIPPRARVDYGFLGVSGLYYLKGYEPEARGLDFFGRLGVGTLDGEAGGSTNDEQEHDTQVYFGAGAEWRFRDGWAARTELQTFDTDASQLSVSLIKRFGATAKQPPPEPAPPSEPITLRDTDDDGVPDTLDECPETPPGSKVGDDGCSGPADKDNDGVADDKDICPDSPAGETVDELGCSQSFSLDVKAIHFASNSAQLTEEGEQAVTRLAERLQQTRVPLVVEAHTDSVGAAAYNRQLSEQRAASVVARLVELGIARERLTAVGKGESEPVADNDTAEGRADNRRVEFVIQENDD